LEQEDRDPAFLDFGVFSIYRIKHCDLLLETNNFKSVAVVRVL